MGRRPYSAAGAARLGRAVGRGTALGAAGVVHLDLLAWGLGLFVGGLVVRMSCERSLFVGEVGRGESRKEGSNSRWLQQQNRAGSGVL